MPELVDCHKVDEDAESSLCNEHPEESIDDRLYSAVKCFGLMSEEDSCSNCWSAEGLEHLDRYLLLLKGVCGLSRDLIAEVQVPAVLGEAPDEQEDDCGYDVSHQDHELHVEPCAELNVIWCLSGGCSLVAEVLEDPVSADSVDSVELDKQSKYDSKLVPHVR